MRKLIVTIDPGQSGTGIALWSAENFGKKDCRPIDAKNYYPSRMSEKGLIKWLNGLCHIFNDAEKVYIEKPSYMENSEMGMASARTGALVKLCMFTGMIRALSMICGAKTFLIDVKVWKGTLPKNLVHRRIKKRWPECKFKSHCMDAIGIGFHLAGLI